jgi:hypothetical protein
MGCLLFAWWYGYSPFECEFTENGTVRVVECSHLRVLSRVPQCPHDVATYEDRLIGELVDYILVRDLKERPFLTEVIYRVRTVRSGLLSGGKGNDADRERVRERDRRREREELV